MFSPPLSLQPLSLHFLYFHGVKTEANGANSKVTGVALFPPTPTPQPETKVALQRRDKGCHTILIEFLLSHFRLHCGLSKDIAFNVAKSLTVQCPFFSPKTGFMLSL